MRLVEDDRVVLVQEPVGGRFRQQHPVRHQLDVGFGPGPVGETDLVTDLLAQRHVQLLGQPGRNGPRCQAARLRVPDHSVHPPPHLQADLGDLRGFPGTRLSADDHCRMPANRVRNLRPLRVDRERTFIGDGGQPPFTNATLRHRPVDVLGQLPQLLLNRFPLARQLFQGSQATAQPKTIRRHRQVNEAFNFLDASCGHDVVLVAGGAAWSPTAASMRSGKCHPAVEL